MRVIGFFTTAVVFFLYPIAHAADVRDLLTLSLDDLSKVNVVTPTKRAQVISNVPTTTYSISAEKILQRGYRNLVQLLQDIPEVEVSARGFVETYNLVTVRGISGVEKNFIIMQDGIRISAITGSPTANHWNYPLYHAKRVEVVLSPASALYGADATNGVIDIITKDASDLQGGTLTVSGGAYSTTDNSVIYGRTFGDVYVMAYGSFYYSAEPFFPELYPSEYAWYNAPYKTTGQMHTISGGITTVPIESWSTPTYAYTAGAKAKFHDFELGYWRNFGQSTASQGDHPDKSLYVNESQIQTVVEALYGRYIYTPEAQNWSLKAELIKGAQGLLPNTSFKNYNTDYISRYAYEVDNSITFNGELSYRFQNQYHLISGINYTDYSTLPRVGNLTSPYNSKAGTGSQGDTYSGTNIDLDYYSLWYQNFGVYAQLQNPETDRLQVTLGARYDYNSRYQGTFNPRVGGVYQFNSKLKGKLLYAEAYRAPPPWLAYGRFGTFRVVNGAPVGGVFNLPNPDLQPERLRSVESSFTYQATNSLSFTADGFANLLTNAFFTREPLPPGTLFHGVPVTGTHPVNKGTVHTYGGTFRVDATYRTEHYFLNPFIAYTYVNGDINGGPIVNAAPSTIKGALDITKDHFLISPQLQFRSRSLVPNTVDVRTPSYLVFNLAARYENLFKSSGRDKVALFVNALNLFNRRYYNANVADDRPMGLTPQDPLRVEGGAALEF